MDSYKCPRCLYTTTIRARLIEHINKTNVCQVINTKNQQGQNISIENVRIQFYQPPVVSKFPCTQCNKSFNRKFCLSQHMRSCKGIKQNIDINPDEEHQNLDEDQDHEIVQVQEPERDKDICDYYDDDIDNMSFEDMKRVFKQLSNKHRASTTEHTNTIINNKINSDTITNNKNIENITSSIVNNGDNNNTTINIIVDNSTHTHNHITAVNNFGEENMEYVTKEFALACFEKGAHGILAMLKEIFFNYEHTENHNVQLKSLNNRLVKVMENKEWVTRALDPTLDTMIGLSQNKIIADSSEALKREIDNGNSNLIYKMQEINGHNNKQKKDLKNRAIAVLDDIRDKTKADAKAKANAIAAATPKRTKN